MFTKTMTFEDLEGKEVSQTFYFNFTKKEIAELLEFGQIQRFAKPGEKKDKLEVLLEKLSTPMEKSGLSNEENNRMAYNAFNDLLLDAYGVKSADNVSFDKTPELRHYWSTHVAFPELIFEFIENPSLASTFIEKCLPPKMVAEAKKELEKESKLEGANLSALIEEANERQKDPATRIEPGPEAAQEALQSPPEIVALAEQTAATPAKKKADYTPDDIDALSDAEFEAFDVKGLSQQALMRAFERKTRS